MPLYSLHMALGTNDCLYFLPPNDFDRGFARTYQIPHVFHSQTKFYAGSVFSVMQKLGRAFWEVDKEFKQNPWNLVVSTGGYAAVPACLHAILHQIPLYLVEPNSVAGKVNKLFSVFAKRVYTHFPSTQNLWGKKIFNYGNPLRREIQRLSKPGEAFLAFGASLGAQSINLLMSKIVQKGAACSVIWITGAKEYPLYSHLAGPGVTILPFSTEIDALYKKAKLVLGRAGAGTVAEMQELGMPSILVPYPHHKDRQQFHNAAYLVDRGAALMKTESELQASLEEIEGILAPKSEQYNQLFKNAQALPVLNAAQRIVEDLRTSSRAGF